MKVFPVILILLLYSLINFYIAFRGWQALPNIKFLKISYIVMMIFLAYGYVAGMLLSKHIPLGVSKTIEYVGSTWFFMLIYLTMAAVLIDLTRLFDHWFHFLPEIRSVAPLQIRQRVILSVLGIVTVVFSIGYYHFRHPKVETVDLFVKNDNVRKKELKIVVSSDLHLGNMLGKKSAQRFVNLINAQRPDIILLVGDVVNADLRPLEHYRLYEELQQLTAPLGAYAVLGNHEYIGDVLGAINFLKKSNIKVLQDDFLEIENTALLIGRDDRSNYKRLTLKELREKAPENGLPIILMDHQPYHLEEVEANNITLALSGHTHDGQVWPVSWIVRGMYENAHGYLQKGNSHFYVSSGLGLWGGPFRIGTQSEIAVIQMHF